MYIGKFRIGSRSAHWDTMLQTGQDKDQEASLQEWSANKYSPGLKDTNPLRSCSGNRAKMFLKSHFGIKRHSQYNKVIRLFQHSSIKNLGGWLRMHSTWSEDYHSVNLTRIQFFIPKSHTSWPFFPCRLEQSNMYLFLFFQYLSIFYKIREPSVRHPSAREPSVIYFVWASK